MIKIGEKLKEERKKRKLTVEEVAKATRIRPEFLEAIEEGHFEKLPGSSYAHGFVKNYLEFLDFPVEENLALFRREYELKEQRNVLPEGLSGGKGIPVRRFSFQHIAGIGTLILLGIFAYLLFQYRAAFWPPSLSVSQPPENALLKTQTVSIAGTTDPDTAVTVNNLPAYVDATGHFTKEIPVFPGNVTLVIKAVNSFGKTATIDRHIQVAVQ